MKTYVLNLFIVDNDNFKLTALKNFLDNRFGTSVSISVFKDSGSMLKKIERYTNIVIADFSLEDENDILQSIKEINTRTEVVILSNHEDIALEIESFKTGSINYIIKAEKLWHKKSWMQKIVSSPNRLIQRVFVNTKLGALFL